MLKLNSEKNNVVSDKIVNLVLPILFILRLAFNNGDFNNGAFN